MNLVNISIAAELTIWWKCTVERWSC